ncbi:MAG TPA: hypothetical protein VGP61_07705, partial [Gemmatimonadales bacterium]|nr:hypothetical protein [Gemmatimonadales bacterium]
MKGSRTARALHEAAGPLRRRLGWVGGLGALSVLLLVLALAAWGARAGVLRSPLWVPLAWLLGLAAAMLAGGLALRARHALGSGGLAIRLEREAGWRRGALAGLLEPVASGTSERLRTAADTRAAGQVNDRAPAALQPQLAGVVRLLGMTLLALVAGAVLLGAASGRRGPTALLWQPLRAIAMLRSPLELSAVPNPVNAGDSVALLFRAPGRQRVTLWTRAPGTSWEPRVVTLDSLGQARRLVGPLAQALYAHLTAGRRSSDTIEVTVRRPAFLATLALTIRYPSYLHLEDEPAAAGGDTLLLPAGSRIEARGEATVRLGAARWECCGRRASLRVSGSRFDGFLLPAVSGAYHLVLRTAEGLPLGGEEMLLPVRLLPDLAPV